MDLNYSCRPVFPLLRNGASFPAWLCMNAKLDGTQNYDNQKCNAKWKQKMTSSSLELFLLDKWQEFRKPVLYLNIQKSMGNIEMEYGSKGGSKQTNKNPEGFKNWRMDGGEA